MDIHKRIAAVLSDLESRAQLRHLETPCGTDFSSNDYLGLGTDPGMKAAVLEALNSATRVGSQGSRLLSGHDEAWTALESDFAKWVGTEAALYFTSGYAANMGLLSALLRPEDVVFSDSANHASLIEGIRLAKCQRVIFPHLDLNFLEEALREHQPAQSARVIVVESLFSMEGDRAPLGELAALAEHYGAELIVDEAHAIGVRGPAGSGLVAEAGLSSRVFATVHTCGKALASAGAFVCGSENLRRFLINRARTFVFNTALPPYFAAQVAAGVNLAVQADYERARLIELSGYLRHELRSNGFYLAGIDSQIVPVILGSNEAALYFSERLTASGLCVRAIRPPTVPPGSARLRLSLTAKHSKENMQAVVAGLVRARAEYSCQRTVSVCR